MQITPAIIHGALDLHQTRSPSFYDAFIVQAASVAGCDTLFSEDMNAGKIIGGGKVRQGGLNTTRIEDAGIHVLPDAA